MASLTGFLTAHIIDIYFVYGLGFFILGMAVALESGHASALPLAHATPWLAAFGLLHAVGEWVNMLVYSLGEPLGFSPALAMEAFAVSCELASFLCLLKFGIELVALQRPSPRLKWVIPGIVAACIAGTAVISVRIPFTSIRSVQASAVWSTYVVALPAFAITVWGLLLQSRSFRSQKRSQLANELTGAAIAFCWYAVFDCVFVPGIPYFPASIVNANLFLDVVGIPIQIFRAANALVIAFFFIRALRLFAAEDRQRLETVLATERSLQERSEKLNAELREAANEMSVLYDQLRKNDEVHSYLLKRVVQAQEEERRRVARDLHDSVGQTLSGLAAGLTALEKRCRSQDPSVHQQMGNMKTYAVRSLDELHRVITDLRPSLLDELGLVPALRWYARHYGETLPISVTVEVVGQSRRLPPEIAIVLFRIAQEALTNIVRHARANTATIRLAISVDRAVLEIEDDGIGFDLKKTFDATGENRPWGLLGMQERAALVGGSVDITSQAWQGSKVTVQIPLPVEPEAEQTKEQESNARVVG